VRLVALVHGVSLLVITGFCVLLAAALGDFKSALICLVICGAGVGEVQGARLLKAGESRGMVWLMRSPIYLLTVILVYVGWQLATYDPAEVRRLLESSPEVKSALEENGLAQADVARLMSQAYYLGYAAVAILSFLYLGGMALYYRSRRAIVTAALEVGRVIPNAPV